MTKENGVDESEFEYSEHLNAFLLPWRGVSTIPTPCEINTIR
jgi:hypothetical protein